MSDTKTASTVTLTDPCWIRPNDVINDGWHYTTREEALAPDDPADADWVPPSVVRQLDKRCVYVVCGCCGEGCDIPSEGAVYHGCTTQAEAEDAAEGSGWVRTADGWACRPCSARDCGWHTSSEREAALHG